MKNFCCFSEAIREGAKNTPRGARFSLLDGIGGTCAIGAGAIAIGLPKIEREGQEFLPFNRTLGALHEMYPYLRNKIECPACGATHCLMGALSDLFDVTGRSRHEIADWLESEEEKLGFVTVVESAQTEVSDVVMV
jgi:hypothetical protein